MGGVLVGRKDEEQTREEAAYVVDCPCFETRDGFRESVMRVGQERDERVVLRKLFNAFFLLQI